MPRIRCVAAIQTTPPPYMVVVDPLCRTLAPLTLSRLPSSSSLARRCCRHASLDPAATCLPMAPEDVQETGLFVFVLYVKLLELEGPGAAAIDPSPSAMDARAAVRSVRLRPPRATPSSSTRSL
ncbi:uncharacterized protein LOC125548421 [Triticum urartu]|uniref:uncharacterized protein LOC125548421 n=1 Tax=Triticum urartu TaxID=4572 RepID=UPI0020447352|nr:uncharacterized protein LOC125548421 [Triticum urartu]